MNIKKTFVYRTAHICRSGIKKAALRINSLLIWQNSPHVFCPCCGLKLKSFADGKFSTRPDRYDVSRYEGTEQKIVCPVCGSLPRHRILAVFFDNSKELFTGETLHFAQEDCLKRFFKRSALPPAGGKIISADLFETAQLQLDIQNTGLEDGRFKLIICNHILEHVPDYKKALRELYRICAPGGCAVISFPMLQSLPAVYEDPAVASAEERIRHFGQFDHLRIFGSDSEKLIEEAGFSVEIINGGDFPREIMPLTGPADYDSNILFLCRKEL